MVDKKMIIYKITNLVNNKIYIGQTTQLLKKRLYQHKNSTTLLGQDIRKFGIENFKSEVLEECFSRAELNKREFFWIMKENSLYPNGYNKSLPAYYPPDSYKKSNSEIRSEIITEIETLHDVISSICGKYKIDVLIIIEKYKIVRFNELKRYIGKISYKVLSDTLKQLQADGLIERKEYPQIPPKVEYSLTEKGKSLIPILDSICEWGDIYK